MRDPEHRTAVAMGQRFARRQGMKAFLLAGGRGERLHPITLSTPKCLVPVDGEPLLGIWLDHLVRHGVDEVLLNVSHHADQVAQFLATRPSSLRVTVVREPAPVGNAGTVAGHRDFIGDDGDFWILYSDNLTTVDLAALRRFHAGHAGVLTMGLFEAPDPRQAGIVSLAPDGRITGFEEKPEQPAGTLANAGIYLARRELLDLIPRSEPVTDFGLHVFPRLAGRLYGHPVDGLLIDIGTPQGLARASRARAAMKAASLEA
jgi:mannose-1-phosphate guanylyltransferase